MSIRPEFFPIAIGEYKHFENLDVEGELNAIGEILAAFSCNVIEWDTEMCDRGGDAVNDRLAEWSASVSSQTILYWVGHGWSDDERAALAHAWSPRAVRSSGVTPDLLADAIARRRSVQPDSWMIVVIDACGSKRFVRLLKAAVADRPGDRALLLVGGLRGEGATTLGAFSDSIRHILAVTCATDYEIPLRQLAYHLEKMGAEVEQKLLLDLVLRRRHAMLVNIDLETLAELNDALQGLTSDEIRHFLPKAHGGELPFKQTMLGEQCWYFQGRHEETRRIVSWLKRSSSGLFVVTGPAGSGKSALLGHLVVNANSTLRTALLRAKLLNDSPEDERPPENIFSLVLHLTGASPAEVVSRIADGIGVMPPSELDIKLLVSWLTSRLETAGPLVILCDALDEAVSPLIVAHDVLRKIASVPNVRMLIGTRASTWEQPDLPAPDVNLLTALNVHGDRILIVDRSSKAVADYMRNRLWVAVRTGALSSKFNIERVSKAAYRKAPQFLFARLIVHEILADATRHSPKGWADLVASRHRRLFGIAVDRLDAAHPTHIPLLRALAYARGRGLPVADNIWITVARALAPGQRIEYGDIDRLTRDAAPYVLADREYGQTVYRLAHRTFAEYFTNETTPSLHDRSAHLAIVKFLLMEVERVVGSSATGNPPINPYLRELITAHVGKAGLTGWEVLEQWSHVLAVFNPSTVASDAVLSAYGNFRLPSVFSGIVDSSQWLQTLDILDRRLGIQLATVRQTGVLRSNSTSVGRRRLVELHAATMPPRQTGQQVLAGHTSWIRVLAAVPSPDGHILLASGSDDRTVRLWNPETGEPVGDPLVGHSDGVLALATLPMPTGAALLVSGSSDQTVRVWDLDTHRLRRQLFTPRSRAYDPNWVASCRVRALASVSMSATCDVLASGHSDSTIHLWDPVTEKFLKDPQVGHTQGVRALVAVPMRDGSSLLASGGNDGTVRLWDPSSEQPCRYPVVAEGESVRALVAVPMRDGSSLLASGSNDGTVRLWDPCGEDPCVSRLVGHTEGVNALATVPMSDGSVLLASGSYDGTVRFWDSVGHELVDIVHLGAPVHSICWVGGFLAVGLDGLVILKVQGAMSGRLDGI
ncbi:hypothetical protein OHB26_25065 [Nocardia sp. NBC_01503]|uniref:hypothetical protein n=1 Tax=Nocardia sp. NBC_01503 TaxID=2975997 RepID=UPI002E7C3C3D|nr:hypothetical protein [Nocardia sp. NBC_01503]WTL30205.1 hypothetical protein OHB26_25065 [Nocardia sp. NBC_01503]